MIDMTRGRWNKTRQSAKSPAQPDAAGPKLTDIEAGYLRVLNGIEDLRHDRRLLVHCLAESLRDTVCRHGPEGLLALSLVTAELAARK